MRKIWGGFILALVAALLLAACGGGGSNSSTFGSSSGKGTIYVTGSDAPLPSVVAFQVTIQELGLSQDGTTFTNVLTEPAPVEFSRLLGLRTLLGLNSIDKGVYTHVRVKMASPVISYLNMATNPPGVSTLPGSFVNGQDTVTLPLNPSLEIKQNGLGGLHFHLPIRQALEVGTDGQITGRVNPVLHIRRLIDPNDPDAHVDELRGSVVSVNVAGNSFVMQRPHGREFTVRVDNGTRFEGSESLGSLTAGAIVEISGKVLADGSFAAKEIEVITRDRAVLGGLILGVDPATGDASKMTMLVRTEWPDLSAVPVGGAVTLDITNATTFDIRRFELPVENFLFNRSQMVVGQRIAVGGVINNSGSLDVRRVLLRRQGVEGMVDDATVTVTGGNEGSFQLANNGLFGYILGGNSLKVATSNATVFRNVSGLSGMTDGRYRVVGLLLKDRNAQPLLVAGYVEKMTGMQ